MINTLYICLGLLLVILIALTVIVQLWLELGDYQHLDFEEQVSVERKNDIIYHHFYFKESKP